MFYCRLDPDGQFLQHTSIVHFSAIRTISDSLTWRPNLKRQCVNCEENGTYVRLIPYVDIEYHTLFLTLALRLRLKRLVSARARRAVNAWADTNFRGQFQLRHKKIKCDVVYSICLKQKQYLIRFLFSNVSSLEFSQYCIFFQRKVHTCMSMCFSNCLTNIIALYRV